MSYLQSNLRNFIAARKTSQNAVALEAGISQSTLNRIMAPGGTRFARDDTVEALAVCLHVSSHDLKYVDLFAEGGEVLPSSADTDSQATGPGVRILAATEFPRGSASRLSPIGMAQNVMVSRAWLSLQTDAPAKNVRYAFAIDDSMQGEIEKGDTVFIDTSVQTVETEGVYAFTYFNVPHIKHGQVLGENSLRFTGTRPSLNSIPVEGDQLKGLVIIGKVFASLSTKRF
ncbi:LexA family transcriptional regulator [Dyella sp. AtDHG13]|uniref:LexA family transcriptional regulator n=1 Tax=Dyella sp. AtDHG13 TaxID=1938897 RepID=UPI00094224D1|nr:LexA family transcriptional regulator [Dyella sp. AtDHG13]